MLEEILARFVAMAWLGWVLAGVMVATTVWAFWRQRKKRTEGGWDNGLTGPIPIEGFADCHYPEDLDEWESKLLTLVDVRDNVMQHCTAVYATTERWIVPKLALVYDTLDEKHPNVFWSRAGDRIVLKVQDDMYWHFAGEVHNVFRFGMYGPGSDKKTYSPQDRKDALAVRAWVAERYKEG